MVTGIPVYGAPQPRRLKAVRLHFAAPETVMLDGDPFEQVREMELSCRPAALNCMQPGPCDC